MKDLAVGVLIFLIFIAICVIFVNSALFMSETSCEKTAQEMGFEFKWDFYTGCLIKVNGQFLPLKNYYIEKE